MLTWCVCARVQQADYKCNDDTTANDNLHAVEAFYTKFPELKPNGFFITGESYVAKP